MKFKTNSTITRVLHTVGAKINALYSAFERSTVRRPFLTPVTLALLLNLTIEILGRRSILDELGHLVLHPYVFLINALILLMTLLPAYLFSRRAFVLCCITVGWLILGITNFVLLGMRNTPLAAIDFGLIVSCFGIIDVYLNVFQLLLIGIGSLLILLGMYRLFRRTKKLPMTWYHLLRRIGAVGLSGIGFVLILLFSFRINAFTTEFADLSMAYRDYGFAYCFSLSVLDRGVDRPVDYSGEEISEILDNIGADSTAITEETRFPAVPADPTESENHVSPNVIFVQLESFFDVKRLRGLSFSEDPTPIFTALKESCPSGYLTVPSIGAGTANTEFEILSGMNLDDFGAGEYPYKTILRQTTCESMAYNLASLGYAAHALHNNTGTFYERHEVYSMLGFETFVPLEHMTDVTENPLGWAKDAVLTKEIRACLDSTAEQDFVFAVSVQPHGKYPDDPAADADITNAYDLPAFIDRIFDDEAATETVTDPARISVSGIDDPSLAAQYTYYVNQLYETDAFLGALIADLTAASEPSVLVLYGDHLPCFDYTADDMADGSTPYQTEYVIWSNYPIDAADRDLHAYQLSAYVQLCIGTEEGILTRLHQNYFSDILSQSDYLASLEMLEYDMLYGNREVWDGINPYLPTDLQYGINPIRIHSVRTIGTSLYVTGEHFTPYSKVSVDQFPTETVYVDEHTLMLPDADPEDGARITVIQSGADNIPLGESNTYIYNYST